MDKDNLKQAKILVVDDNDDVRYQLERRLRRLGADSIETAEDGERALEKLAEKEFDLVLLDIMMPRVSGYEVLEKLHELDRLANLPVIVISAMDEIASATKCIELGAEDYLTKPVNSTLLAARVKGSLEKKRLRDEVSRQLKFIRRVFGRYVPDTVVDSMLSQQGELKPKKEVATILFTDIAGFTSMVEKLTPERTVEVLNEYFSAVIAPVLKNGGTVNQFQGDAMLITFNVPVSDPRHADNAVKTAIEIQQAHEGLKFKDVSFSTRIGINTGEIVAGNIGSGERVNYTVHGDAVNLAARLEQLNKTYSTNVLVSASTVGLLSDNSMLESLGEADVRGKEEAIEVFGLVS